MEVGYCHTPLWAVIHSKLENYGNVGYFTKTKKKKILQTLQRVLK